ncbi:hypothetical protein CTEN210_04118 [Chaetoceros tenuissimus]|uniref:Uncharacterized protein n=1 Tax=Chaetoceros tenuissimus TaxID=426638 RepID=A0AAD3H2G3_9STRA|nr:hypothetical protein CTEN210_04118 [Chaetoceros tenuissimus]
MKVSHTSCNEVPSASISDLPNDLLKHCFSFIPGSYVTVAPVSRQFFSNYSTRGMDDSTAMLSAASLLKIGRNKRTTVDAVSSDIKLTEYCFINAAPKEFMMKVYQSAALKSRIDILQCANIFGVDLIKFVPRNLTIKLAEAGNLEMIQYFDRKLPEDIDRSRCNFLFELAKESDHVHIMKWLIQEKSHLYEDDSSVIAKVNDKPHIQATIEAYEHIFAGVTAPEVNFELNWIAARKGNIETLEYCHRNNYQFDIDDTMLCDSSMENEDKEQALVTLKWLHEHDCPWDESLCYSAAWYENLEALIYARNNNCPWDETTLSAAAERGNIAMIEYCLENDCPMDVCACAAAMNNKNENIVLEVLKLLRKYSCPWAGGTCVTAVGQRHFEALRWAKRNGCAWEEHGFHYLVRKGSVCIIEEFLQNEPRHNTNIIFQEALRNESLNDSQVIEKLKLLRKYGYEWNTNTTLEAARQGRLQVLQWLRFVGCALDVESCTASACTAPFVVRSENTEVLKYLQGIAN